MTTDITLLSSPGPARTATEQQGNWQASFSVPGNLTQWKAHMVDMMQIANQEAADTVEPNWTPAEGERFHSTSMKNPRTLVILSGGVVDGPPRRIRVNAQNEDSGKVSLLDVKKLADPKYFNRVV
jgi:hypothetical protein